MELTYSDEEIDATLADHRIAELLDIPRSTPLLRMRQLIFSTKGRATVYVMGLYGSGRRTLRIRRVRSRGLRAIAAGVSEGGPGFRRDTTSEPCPCFDRDRLAMGGGAGIGYLHASMSLTPSWWLPPMPARGCTRTFDFPLTDRPATYPLSE